MKKIKVGIIGFGNRGSLYAKFIKEQQERAQLVAVADFRIDDITDRLQQYDIAKKYKNSEDLFNDKLDLDLLIISSMDKYHFQECKKAIMLGYNVLLEKPISVNKEEILELERLANEKGVKVVVCHVLRYTIFYKEIKRLIASGKIGDIVNINATENVAFWHQAHSFVRGNWHNTKECGPEILTKCSHDMDIITWLMNKNVKKISSFGDLYYFKKKNKPIDSASRCCSCKLKDECDFNCYKFYLENREWLTPFIGLDLSDEKIDNFLKTSDFGRCVFDMDNDTVDHQVVNILFDDATTASLTMNAFSRYCYRDIKIYGTKADIIGNFESKIITVNYFDGSKEEIDINKLTSDFEGHGGGDRIMLNELLDYLQTGKLTSSLTLLHDSVISHLMSLSAEESRINEGKVIDLEI